MPPVKKVKASNKPKVDSKLKEDTKATEAVVSGQLAKQLKKKPQLPKNRRGLVLIRHLPHGFFEDQLKGYFEQFGKVTRVRLARSRRTGTSKGFAYVEFEYPEVAQVAAETMDNYLMFKKLVKALYIPPENQRFNYFKTNVRKIKNKVGKEIYVSGKITATNRKVNEYNDASEETFQKRTLANVKKIKNINKKFKDLGIDFSSVMVPPKLFSASKGSEAADGKKSKTSGKRKNTTTAAAAVPKQKQKKADQSLELADLLGNTINDDSEDEDYIDLPDSDEESEGEEDFLNLEALINEENSEEEEEDTPVKQKNIKSFGKPIVATKEDRFEKLIKRKPLQGGIKKSAKKADTKPATTSKAKNALKLKAAKEVAKKLPKTVGINKKLKAGKGQKA